MKLLSITQSNTKVKKSMKYFDQYKWHAIKNANVKNPDYASLSLMQIIKFVVEQNLVDVWIYV